MPRSTQIPEHESSVQSLRIPLPAKGALLVLLAAVSYGLWFQLGTGAPLEHIGHPPLKLIAKEESLWHLALDLRNASKGGNIELRIDASDSAKQMNKEFFAVPYYSFVYDLYPQRVFIGSDDYIINNADGLYAADQLPPVAWMRQHQVSTVFRLTPPVQPGTETMNAK